MSMGVGVGREPRHLPSLSAGPWEPDPASDPALPFPTLLQVVLVALQKLHELSQAGGASSLRSSELDLHISDSLGDGGLLGALRSWEELMDTQP